MFLPEDIFLCIIAPMETKVYTPELIPRRGELNAWAFALVATITWLILRMRITDVPLAASIFVWILILSAASISLGNWMDRNTALTISPSGIAYQNGVRRVTLKWEEINEVRVSNAQWGKRVEVIGEQAHFRFHTLGEVIYNGEIKGRMGFAKGDDILHQILSQSGLEKREKTSQTHYYARP